MDTNKTRIILVSVLGGIALSGAALFLFVNSNPQLAENYIKSFKGLPPEDTIVDVGQANADLGLRKYGLAIPSSKASSEYKNAFELAFNELDILDSTFRTSLYPLLVGLKDKSGNYDELSSSILKIRGINEIEKKRIAILGNYLDNFSSANQKTADAETKSLTSDLISKFITLNDAFSSYFRFVDKMVSGRINEGYVEEGKAVAANLASAKKAFLEASKKLTEFFIGASRAVSTSPTIVKPPAQ